MLLSSDCHPVGPEAAIPQGSQAQTLLGHKGLLEITTNRTHLGNDFLKITELVHGRKLAGKKHP